LTGFIHVYGVSIQTDTGQTIGVLAVTSSPTGLFVYWSFSLLYGQCVSLRWIHETLWLTLQRMTGVWRPLNAEYVQTRKMRTVLQQKMLLLLTNVIMYQRATRTLVTSLICP